MNRAPRTFASHGAAPVALEETAYTFEGFHRGSLGMRSAELRDAA